MPYICLTRDDIPDGVLFVGDLWPSTSLRNAIVDPVGQTKYINRVQNETVAVSGTATSAEYKGLAAYLIDSVADGGDGGALTAAQANTMATNIIDNILDAAAACNVASINVELQAVVAATELNANNSVGALADVLRILAGAEYVVPSGTDADTGAGNFKGTQAGAFTSGQYRATYTGVALEASYTEGTLSKCLAATFEYGAATGRAVVVYSDAGAVLA